MFLMLAVEEVLYRRGAAKLRLSDDVLGAAESSAGLASATAVTASAESLRTLQSFDCGVLSPSSLPSPGNATVFTPQSQRRAIAESLQFGAAALVAADKGSGDSKNKAADGGGRDTTDPFASLSIEPILTKAFDSDIKASASASDGMAADSGFVGSTTSAEASATLPASSLPEAGDPEGDTTAYRAREETAGRGTQGESIYVFEQQDFTPFVRGFHRLADDAAVIESLAAAAPVSTETDPAKEGAIPRQVRALLCLCKPSRVHVSRLDVVLPAAFCCPPQEGISPPEETLEDRRLRLQVRRSVCLQLLTLPLLDW